MIKKVIRPAVYTDYNPIAIRDAIVKSNNLYKGGLNNKQIDKVYNSVLKTMDK
jgi:hypothetical protein